MHRIAQCLTTGGPADVVELVELARYLRALYTAPGFGDLQPILRSSYWTALQQCGFALRFRRVGAIDVGFEPLQLSGGRGDLAFSLNGRRFVAESYWPRYRASVQTTGELLFDRVAGVLTESREKLGPERKLRVTMRVKEQLDSSSAKAIENILRRLIVTSPLSTGEWSEDHPLVAIRVEDISGSPETDFDANGPLNRPSDSWIIASRATDPRNIGAIRDGKNDPSERGSRAIVFDPPNVRPPQTPEEIADGLTAKLQKKVSQISGDGRGSARLLLVNFPHLHAAPQVTAAAALKLKGRLIDRRSRMAGVLLCTRRWVVTNRFQWSGLLLEGAEGAGLQERLELLNRLEGQSDLLGPE